MRPDSSRHTSQVSVSFVLFVANPIFPALLDLIVLTKSKRAKISRESFWLKISVQKAFGFEKLGELFLLGGSNPISSSAYLAGISLVWAPWRNECANGGTAQSPLAIRPLMVEKDVTTAPVAPTKQDI